ncbi:MAG: oligosaccharide flippase family protein [Anaerolineae bacterium]|nr:oligosaccharide flippase family protein [Anaerolineae bacterium]
MPDVKREDLPQPSGTEQLRKSLAARTVASVAWNSTTNLAKIGILLLRSVLLARLLPVETFGVYAWASSVIRFSSVLPSFGLGAAFLHRCEETENEDQATAVHFTLKLIFTLAWTLLAIGLTLGLARGETRLSLIVLTFAVGGLLLTQTPEVILIRRVEHRRLAVLDLLNAVLTTAIAVAIAWQTGHLWALLATDLVTLILSFFALYVWKPVWRPKLVWQKSAVRYYLRFGNKVFWASVLAQALDKVDDLWTGVFLGDTAMGYYSRAYVFATYPRVILAQPIDSVVGGTFAELKGDRKRLSQAFFRTTALMVRSGFLVAGLLALVAPEFIRLVLGAKWLPMLDAFRLMLIFTLLDPIKTSVASLFLAVGRPEQVVQARVLQLLVLVAGLLLLGLPFGITGVALAVDGMLVVGMIILFWRVRQYVDYSVPKLLVPPAVSLVIGLALARLALLVPGLPGTDWGTAVVKIAVFLLFYGGLLSLWERHTIRLMATMLQSVLKRR